MWSARNPIECAFGRLKARWRFLTRKIDRKLEEIPTVIYAYFVLHNYCEKTQCVGSNEGEGEVVRTNLTGLIH